jgi:hypothetical protein
MHLPRHHKLVRSFNSPIADVAEWLVSTKLGLQLATGSAKGYDALDERGIRYQIKASWLATPQSSSQLSAIRDLTEAPFDHPIAVMFDVDLHVCYVAQMTLDFVIQNSTRVDRTNSYRFYFKRSMLASTSVCDLTERCALLLRQLIWNAALLLPVPCWAVKPNPVFKPTLHGKPAWASFHSGPSGLAAAG